MHKSGLTGEISEISKTLFIEVKMEDEMLAELINLQAQVAKKLISDRMLGVLKA